MPALKLIDIDSHVLEPPDLWVNNIEPEYKDRALRFEKDEKGWEYMCVDNQHHHGYFLDGGIFGRAGAGQPNPPHPIEDYLTPGKVGYAEGRPPGAYDPDEHVKVLDQRGIDTVILYPTLGLTWETVCPDAGPRIGLRPSLQRLDRRLLRHQPRPSRPRSPRSTT